MWLKIKPTRKEIMRAVRSKDTTPEMIVRRIVHGLGYRYRLHRKDLPGKPDLVFPRIGKVVFVNGCFWHGHCCRRGSRQPKENADYWRSKIARNIERDAEVSSQLSNDGWQILTVWECETKAADRELLMERIQNFLDT